MKYLYDNYLFLLLTHLVLSVLCLVYPVGHFFLPFKLIVSIRGAIGRAAGGTIGGAIGGAIGGTIGGTIGGAIGRAIGGTIGGTIGGAIGRAIGGTIGGAIGRAIGRAIFPCNNCDIFNFDITRSFFVKSINITR